MASSKPLASRRAIIAALLSVTALTWGYWQYTTVSVGLVQPLAPAVHTTYVAGASLLQEPIVITMFSLGLSSAIEGTTAIKSALMHSSRPIDFHIICDEAAADHIDTRFKLFTRPAYGVNVTYYPIPQEFTQARLERANISPRKPSDYYLLTKVFMHELIDVEKSLYIDTDMIFVVDPVQLWNTFSTFDSKTMVAFPTQGRGSHPGKICSCVMLMHYYRMREAQFMPSTLLPNRKSIADEPFARGASEKIQNAYGQDRVPFDRHAPFFGDQGIYHVLWTFRPDLFRHLSLRWDVSHCRKAYGMTLGHFGDDDGETVTEEEQVAKQWEYEGSGEKLIVPGILHFNCQGDNIPNAWMFAENHEENPFGPMVTVAQRYKWIWLNRGDGSAKVTVTRKLKEDIRWLDEREAFADGSPGSHGKRRRAHGF